ncbi:MAG TPA: HAMP domain-containing sensor histidine kinase, partial [Roseiarcus sp.]|nr:HAMP domain-containing sensor histidine kinase [Roseiarcus sp.]
SYAPAMMRMFARSHKSATPAMCILIVAVGLAATLWVPQRMVLIWASIALMSITAQYGFAITFLEDAAHDEASYGLWRRKFILAEALVGVGWALIVVLLLGSHDPSARTYVLMVLLMVAAMTAMIASPIPYAVAGGLLPVTIAIVYVLGPSTRIDSLTLSFVCVGGLLYFVVLANRLHTTSIDGESLRAEKDALIAELEQAKLNSDEARRRAEEANLAKSRFLATMSHELRTPLNAILGFSEVMKAELFGAHSAPCYKEYALDIHASGQHLLVLINEILDLSRVEAGRYELKEEPVSLALVVEESRHLLGLRAKNRDIEIVEQLDANLPRIWADERAVRQVALNLLSNAIKFTPQGGEITIKVGWTGAGGQYLSIRDTGPGIPEEEIPIVLSSFGRGSLAQKNAEEGSGLGLPIVKGLVELHGGEFELRSKVREGTEAIVIFPPERVMDALPQLDPNEPAPRPSPPKRRAAAA